MPYIIAGVVSLLAAIGLFALSVSGKQRDFELPYTGSIICVVLAIVAFVNGALTQ